MSSSDSHPREHDRFIEETVAAPEAHAADSPAIEARAVESGTKGTTGTRGTRGGAPAGEAPDELAKARAVMGHVQALVLDAAMTAAESLERLELYAGEVRVVIRRLYNRRLFFYLFTAGDLKEKLGRVDTALPLEAALGLGIAHPPARTLRPDQAVGRGDAVLLDEDEMVLGVWIAPPRGMRDGSSPAVTRPRDGNLRGAHPRGATRQVGAYPVLDAPEAVAPLERFELEIGLSALRQAGVHGDVVLEVPPDETAADLVVQVIADGFDAPEGLQRILHVVYDDLDRTRVRVPLVAREVERPRTSLLIVHFSRDGAVCGSASRRIVVEPQRPRPSAAPARASVPAPVRRLSALAATSPSAASIVLSPEDSPDLTLILAKPDGNQATGRYVWIVKSPYIACPPEPLPMDLGTDSRSYVKVMLQQVPGQLGKPLQDGWIRTQAMQIGGHVPDEVWDALRRVAAHTATHGRLPRVLLLTSEPYVPWELASFDPPLDESQPRFLGAQVAISRWLPSRVPPPPASLAVERMAVIAAEYAGKPRAKKNANDPVLTPLKTAGPEADELVRAHGATRILAIGQEMQRLLEGELPPGGAQAIHFIGHGRVDEDLPAYGIAYLEDGTVLVPGHLFSAPVVRRERAFLFLNACEVGNGGEMLGTESGFGNEAVRGGCSGFVAPVWPVFEDQAKAFAESFYQKVFLHGRPVGEAMRELRAGYRTNGNGTTPAACLCYIFYGSPALVLTRPSAGNPPDAPAALATA